MISTCRNLREKERKKKESESESEIEIEIENENENGFCVQFIELSLFVRCLLIKLW